MAAGSLTHWRPFGDVSTLRERIDHMFDELVAEDGAKLAAVDVIRGKDEIRIKADMPGIKADDLKIEVSDDVLTIHGEHEESKEEQKKAKKGNGRYIRHERSYSSFSRSLVLPEEVDPKKIKATCENGVVEVVVPLPPKKEPQIIEVTPKEA